MITKNEFIGIYISFSESKCKSLSSCPYIYELDGSDIDEKKIDHNTCEILLIKKKYDCLC